MKKKVEVIEELFDFCGEHASYACRECGKDICHECKDDPKKARDYQYEVRITGSDNGIYCADCDAKLTKNPNPLFTAYKAVEMLIADSSAYWKDFEEKRKRVEVELKKQLQKNPNKFR